MAWAVVERRTTATTRRVPPQRGHDAGPHPGVGGEDAEVAHQVGPGGRDERGHPAEEGHRRQTRCVCPVGEGRFIR
jgi:hypothetical protein